MAPIILGYILLAGLHPTSVCGTQASNYALYAAALCAEGSDENGEDAGGAQPSCTEDASVKVRCSDVGWLQPPVIRWALYHIYGHRRHPKVLRVEC